MRIIDNFDGSTVSKFMTGEEADRDGIGKYHLLQPSTQRGLSCYPLVLSVLPTDELEVLWQLAGICVGWDFVSCDLRLFVGCLPSPDHLYRIEPFHHSDGIVALSKRSTTGSAFKRLL